MNRIKTLIVDDEQAARNVISNLLELAFPHIEIVDQVSNVLDAVASIEKYKPDLVFLDIEMPIYAGYELVKFFDKIDFQIVFVTAYDQYAIKAFEVNAVDYILKPIERERLASIVKKVESNIIDKNEKEKYHSLLEELDIENSPVITISETGKKQLIKTKTIIAVCAHGAYSEIFLSSGKSITVSKNIGAMESELKKDTNFFRSHKSWLINVSHIESYLKGDQLIKLINGVDGKLSRFKKREFETIFEQL